MRKLWRTSASALLASSSTTWPAVGPSPLDSRRRARNTSPLSGALDAKGPLIIGGKSMGGRVASMVADKLYASDRIAGLLCLGYPFHPLGKPDQLRTEHLASLKTPTLIAQGTRDQFGSREEVLTYELSKNIEVLWLEDGDHELKPRKSLSGFSAADHLRTLGEKASARIKRIAG